jgi:hypothetical protein
MYNKNKKYNNFKLFNYIKSCKLFLFLMVKNNNNKILLKKLNSLIVNKYRFNKKTSNLILNSIACNFLVLMINSGVFVETKNLTNSLLLNLITAVRLNNKIYSKFCLTQFLNSSNYFQSKKLIFKLLVSKLKKRK